MSSACSMPTRVAGLTGLSVSKKCRTTPMRSPLTPLPRSAGSRAPADRRSPGPRDRSRPSPAAAARSPPPSRPSARHGPAERQRQHAGAADQAIGRLDAGDAAQRRRAADRPAGVRPVPPRISPAATAAPVPEEEPAVKCSGFHGLRAGGQGRSKDGPPMANSCVASLPSSTVPASAHLRTAWRPRPDLSSSSLECAGRRMPAVL